MIFTTSNSLKSKNKSPDRILVLKVKEGHKALSSKGLEDPGLFSGENELHAIMDTQTCHWSLKYKQGILPPMLKMRFTTFTKLFEYTKAYFDKRNIEITEVQDYYG